MTVETPASDYLALAATIHQQTLFVQHQTTTTQWDGQIHNHRTGTKMSENSRPIIIYGASDDLVEVEGAIREEFDCYGAWEGVLESPDGAKLSVMATYGAKEWELSVYASSEDGYPSWPIQFMERPDREGDPALKILAPEGTTLTERKASL